jgi:hypothetical protein
VNGRIATSPRFAVVAGLLVFLSSCVGPARTFGVYQSKAAQSAEGALSAVQTTRMAIRDALTDDGFGPYLSITIQDADDAASTAQGHFDSVQPPDQRSDRLRRATDELLSGASSVVARARIAVRRHDEGTLRRLLPALARLAKELDRYLKANE